MIWTLPNYIYFKKRKSLFCNNEIKKRNQDVEYNNYEEEKMNNEALDILIKKFEQPQNVAITDKIKTEDIVPKVEIPIAVKEDDENIPKSTNKSIYVAGNHNISNNTWKTSAIVLGITTIILTIILISNIINMNRLNEEIDSLSSTLTSQKSSYKKLQEKYSECSSEKYKLQQKVNFFDNHAVIVPANTRVYHRYDCTYCDKSSFLIYNDETAIVQGYKPCSHCIE